MFVIKMSSGYVKIFKNYYSDVGVYYPKEKYRSYIQYHFNLAGQRKYHCYLSKLAILNKKVVK